MNVKAIFFAFGLSTLPVFAWAQGFAGMGSAADGFAQPKPGVAFDFPTDHGPHPDYRIEWWYVTANLTGEDGRDYGIQWTLFRTALAPDKRPGWQSPQIWMGHAAITTPDAHFVEERFARGGIGQAGVQATPFSAWIDEWQMAGPDLENVGLHAQGPDFAYELNLESKAPWVAQGQNGYSVKSAGGQASYYYSQPFYNVSGVLGLPNGPINVTGQAWLDREWSSQPLADDQTGWDWFSLSFETGDKMMGFRLRQTGGSFYTAATWITADGAPAPFPDGAFTATPLDWSKVAGRKLPTRWRVQLPAKGVDVKITALNTQAWMATAFPYWEGPVRITGTHQGRGYLEMTGYE